MTSTERPIGVVLSDVDATLTIPTEKLPSAEVQAAARDLRMNGIPLLPVTSRPHALMRKLIQPLDLRDNLCTLSGGATVARADTGDIVWSQWMSGDVTRTIICGIGGLCTNIHFDAESRKSEPQAVMELLDQEGVLADGAASVFAIFNTENSPAVLDALGAVPMIRHTPVMSYDNIPELRCIQVMNERVDKRYGVGQMLLHASLQDKRRLVIGDGFNDLPLFEAAGPDGVRVAMGNAPDELKAVADFVAPPVENHGFAVAMHHYGLA